MNWKVPLFDTDMGAEEVDAVSRVIKSGWLTMGEETKSFEREFAEFLGVKHAFMVSNCTAALHLAHHVLGSGADDEVICPSLTFVATANTIVQTGAVPVFADVTSLQELTVSVEDIARKITPRTKGITVMHYGGYPCRVEEILSLARNHGLYVVEDCAHSPGASLGGRMTGTFGDVGCFSFFSNKNLSTGEGGMIVTDRDDLADQIRLVRSHGMTTVTLDRHKGHSFTYDVQAKGFNYRSSEMNAALGRVQLRKLLAKNEARAEVVAQYRRLLTDMEGLGIPFADLDPAAHPAYHIFPVVLPENADREQVMVGLRERGVQSSIHYRPVNTFTAYRDATEVVLPVTDELADRLLTLPLYSAMTPDQVQYVVQSVRESIHASLGRR